MRIFTVLLLLPMLASGGNAAQGGLDWLAGCWITADKSSQEVWVVDSEKSLLGFGVALDAGVVYSRTTGTTLLNRRTFHIAVRTIHATVASVWLEHHLAVLAFIEELARIGRHKVS